MGGGGASDLTVSSIACHRVFGHLSAPSKVSRSRSPTRPSPNTSSHPCSHAAMQTVSVAWKFRSRGCPGKLPDGERCAPAESAPAGSLGEVWRTIRFGGGWVCGERWEGARA